jgi:hypothetical protein
MLSPNLGRVRSIVRVLLPALLFAVAGCTPAGAPAPAPGNGTPAAPPADAVSPAEVEAARAKSRENLQTIHRLLIAGPGRVPGGMYDPATGKPGLSWRVDLPRELGDKELESRIALDEGWDSPANKKVLEKVPAILAPVGPVAKTTKPGYTFYRLLTGPDTMLPPPRDVPPGRNILGFGGLQLANANDGTANTICLVEAGEAVPWTKPEELEYDANGPLPKLGGLFEDGFHVLFCDGTVKFLPRTIGEKTLRALITPNGGEVIDDPVLRDAR